MDERLRHNRTEGETMNRRKVIIGLVLGPCAMVADHLVHPFAALAISGDAERLMAAELEQRIHSTAQTPPDQMERIYRNGGTIIGEQYIDPHGVVRTANLVRILARDGRHYAVFGAGNGRFFAIDEEVAMVWDTLGNPFGDTAFWQPASLAATFLILQWIKELIEYIVRLLIMLLYVTLIFIAAYHAIDWIRRNFTSETQNQFNNFGMKLWHYPPTEEGGHHFPGLRADTLYLAGQYPAFNQRLRADLRMSYWLDTGTHLVQP